MRKLSIGLVLMNVFVLLVLVACKNKYSYNSPPGYDFTNPEKFKMPSSLLEISGIAFKDKNSDTVYSIQDEAGKIYKQGWGVRKQHNVKFASNGDFEDLAIISDKIVSLKSDGSFYTFLLSETSKKKTDLVNEHKKIIPKGEYEGIYANSGNNEVYVLCKKCPVDKKKYQVTGYILKYNVKGDAFSLAGDFKIDVKKLPLLNPRFKASLNPSGMARNVFTNEWFIISTLDKMLVVTDSLWNIKAVYKLNSSLFNQPEGIAFDKENNLFISNEGDEITDGNVLKFKYSNLK